MRSTVRVRGASAAVIALLVWTSTACGQQSARVEAAGSATSTPEQAAATITAEDIGARIAIIADDSMAGRDTPSPGLEATAEWIAEQYAAFGLEPAGEDGTFFQRYPFPLRALDTEGVHFGTVKDGENVMLVYGEDFSS